VLAGLVAALFGLAPRAAAVAWALLAWCTVVGFLGELLGLPQWARNLSPFEHVPKMPVDAVDWVPLVLLTLVAAAATAIGLIGFRRRDITA
jgi:ABC-2 type transport system permease protein